MMFSDPDKKLVSIVIPVFNEERGVKELSQRLIETLRSLDYKFEIVIVDDGSIDDTLNELRSWQIDDNRVVIVKLSRNWGHQSAFNAGLDIAVGDAVIFMDGDMEDPPEVIPDLLSAWREGFDTVYTVKESRHQPVIRKFLTKIYYRLINATTRFGVEPQAGMFSLIDKKVASILRGMTESNKSYPNLRAFSGFKTKRLTYSRGRRRFGKPKQSLLNLINDGLNAWFANTYIPIRIFSVIGLFLSFFFLLVGLTVLFVKITGIEFWFFRDIPGTQMVLLIALVIGSFQILFLGILGEYIARIYEESKNRPYYVIDEVERAKNPPVPNGER